MSRFQEKYVNIVLGAVTVCAIVMTFLVLRRELWHTPASLPEFPVVENWMSFSTSGNRVGPTDASVTIVMFSDFLCRFCRDSYKQLRSLQVEDSDLTVVYRHYPAPGRPEKSLGAIVAAQCAASQGAFFQYADRIFAAQDTLALVNWSVLARQTPELRQPEFDICLENLDASDTIRRDAEAAEELSIRGTPLLLVNELLIQGSPPVGELHQILTEVRASLRVGARFKQSEMTN